MKFDNIKELMDYQNNEINEVMKEIKGVHKKYNLFEILYYRLTMRSRLKRRINTPYTRHNNEFVGK